MTLCRQGSMKEYYRKGGGICCSPLLSLVNPNSLQPYFQKALPWNTRQSWIHIAWVDSALWRTLTKVLSDPYSSLHVFPLFFSYIFGAKLCWVEGQLQALTFSSPPPFFFLCSHPYPPPVLCWAPGLGPSQLFCSLFLHRELRNLPRLLPLPLVLSPQDETLCCCATHMMESYRRWPHRVKSLNLWSNWNASMYPQLWFSLWLPIPPAPHPPKAVRTGYVSGH